MPLDHVLNRRTLVGSTLGTLAGGALLHPVGAQSATPGASPVADGPWTFVDDRGVEVSLDTMPTRVVLDANVAGGLWDFGVRPLGIFGWLSTVTDGALPPAAGSVDPAQVENYGLGEGEIDLERLAAASPDLIVTYTYTPDDPDNLWSVLPDDLDRLQDIAPIVALSGVNPLNETVQRFEELAIALGYDVTTPEVQAVRDDVTAAEGRVRNLTASASYSALWVAPGIDEFYIANPEQAQGVQYARGLGVKAPTLGVEPGAYWETLSYEQALKYPTDILYISDRNGPETYATIGEDHPTFAANPAVAAGQVFSWRQDVNASYPGLLRVLTELLNALEASDPTIADESWS
jgi:iron complex transport system substrate-binding protein